MKFGSAPFIFAVAGVALTALLTSGFATPATADPTSVPTSGAPISVVIPDDSTSDPGNSDGGPSGSGSSGAGSGGPAAGGSMSGSAGHNPDGSPIPPSEPKLNASGLKLDKTSIQADDWMIATGSGYKPGENAQLVLYPGAVIIGSYRVDVNGNFSARFRIPHETQTGYHVAEATGWESGFVANGKFTVVSPNGESDWLTLWWVYLVLGVLVLGILALSIAFRREIFTWFGGAPASGNPA